jgi:hypothetical protein
VSGFCKRGRQRWTERSNDQLAGKEGQQRNKGTAHFSVSSHNVSLETLTMKKHHTKDPIKTYIFYPPGVHTAGPPDEYNWAYYQDPLPFKNRGRGSSGMGSSGTNRSNHDQVSAMASADDEEGPGSTDNYGEAYYFMQTSHDPSVEAVRQVVRVDLSYPTLTGGYHFHKPTDCELSFTFCQELFVTLGKWNPGNGAFDDVATDFKTLINFSSRFYRNDPVVDIDLPFWEYGKIETSPHFYFDINKESTYPIQLKVGVRALSTIVQNGRGGWISYNNAVTAQIAMIFVYLHTK